MGVEVSGASAGSGATTAGLGLGDALPALGGAWSAGVVVAVRKRRGYSPGKASLQERQRNVERLDSRARIACCRTSAGTGSRSTALHTRLAMLKTGVCEIANQCQWLGSS
jgi:hypothetical protein